MLARALAAAHSHLKGIIRNPKLRQALKHRTMKVERLLAQAVDVNARELLLIVSN